MSGCITRVSAHLLSGQASPPPPPPAVQSNSSRQRSLLIARHAGDTAAEDARSLCIQGDGESVGKYLNGMCVLTSGADLAVLAVHPESFLPRYVEGEEELMERAFKNLPSLLMEPRCLVNRSTNPGQPLALGHVHTRATDGSDWPAALCV
ncbi:unnamed protein product [Boreogadus saida]